MGSGNSTITEPVASKAIAGLLSSSNEAESSVTDNFRDDSNIDMLVLKFFQLKASEDSISEGLNSIGSPSAAVRRKLATGKIFQPDDLPLSVFGTHIAGLQEFNLSHPIVIKRLYEYLKNGQMQFVVAACHILGFDHVRKVLFSNGLTPLHIAAIHGHTNIVRFLLDDVKMNASLSDTAGRTSFDWAVLCEQRNTALVLLEATKDPKQDSIIDSNSSSSVDSLLHQPPLRAIAVEIDVDNDIEVDINEAHSISSKLGSLLHNSNNSNNSCNNQRERTDDMALKDSTECLEIQLDTSHVSEDSSSTTNSSEEEGLSTHYCDISNHHNSSSSDISDHNGDISNSNHNYNNDIAHHSESPSHEILVESQSSQEQEQQEMLYAFDVDRDSNHVSMQDPVIDPIFTAVTEELCTIDAKAPYTSMCRLFPAMEDIIPTIVSTSTRTSTSTSVPLEQTNYDNNDDFKPSPLSLSIKIPLGSIPTSSSIVFSPLKSRRLSRSSVERGTMPLPLLSLEPSALLCQRLTPTRTLVLSGKGGSSSCKTSSRTGGGISKLQTILSNNSVNGTSNDDEMDGLLAGNGPDDASRLHRMRSILSTNTATTTTPPHGSGSGGGGVSSAVGVHTCTTNNASMDLHQPYLVTNEEATENCTTTANNEGRKKKSLKRRLASFVRRTLGMPPKTKR